METKRTLNVKNFIDDLEAGMSDTELINKYQVSEKTLKIIFEKLIGKGALKQALLDKRCEQQMRSGIDGNPQLETDAVRNPSEGNEKELESETSDKDQELEGQAESGIEKTVYLSGTNKIKETLQIYRLYIAIIISGGLVTLLCYIAYKGLSLPHESDISNKIEQSIIGHYSTVVGEHRGFKLSNVKVLKATEGVAPRNLKDRENPKKLLCVSFIADTENGMPGVFNVMVRETRSGKLFGTFLSERDLENGRNCPGDWDNICPFTCEHHDELLVRLRTAKEKARKEQQHQIMVETIRRTEEARKRDEEALRLKEQAKLDQLQKNRSLLEACSKADVKAASTLLSEKADINTADENGSTALALAIQANCFELVKILLQNGADANVANHSQVTPLMVASDMGKVHVVETLISRGARIDSQDSNGDTSLTRAFITGNNEVVHTLLKMGSDIRLRNRKGESCLNLACRNGDVQTLKLALDKYPSLDRPTLAEMVHLAIKNHHDEVVATLMEYGADVNFKNSDLCTPLTLSISLNRAETSRLLIACGANLNEEEIAGYPLLREAYSKKNLDLLKVFLSQEEKLNLHSKNVVLTLAVHNNDMEAAKLLLDNGADPNSLNRSDEPLLSAVCKKQNTAMAMLLLDKGADPNLRNSKGNTFLIEAVGSGHADIVQLLLTKGSDVDRCESNGNTPLITAATKGDVAIMEILLRAGAKTEIRNRDGYTALMRAVFAGQQESSKLLVSRGVDINATDNKGFTVLMAAISKGYPEFVELLIDKGADVNARSKDGFTPLMLAIYGRDRQLIESLLNRGAQVDAENEVGLTALMIAAANGYLETVNLLLTKDANVFLVNKDGRTAYDLAIKYGHAEQVGSLLAKKMSAKFRSQ